MTRPPRHVDALPAQGARAATARLLQAVDEVAGLTPDLGWGEATTVVEALLDQLAHRLADAASGQEQPTELPLVVGAIGGADHTPDHASCRAVAARLRATAPLLTARHTGWERQAGETMVQLGDLLDQVADRTRRDRIRASDKGVVLRRLHVMQRALRAGQVPGAVP